MISAVVLVKNQAHALRRCLKSLAWCQEIIVIDDNSTDESAKVAMEMNAKVFKHSLNNDFSLQRNYALSKVRQDWAFFVDADEVVSKELAQEIYQQTTQFLSPFNGFFVKRTDYMWERRIKFGEAGAHKFLRIARVEKGKWAGKVHEVWEVSGSKAELKNSLKHFPHPSVKEFLAEVNYYSTLRAEELYAKKVKSSFLQILLMPPGKFLYNYIVRLGFLDGMPGIIIAIMMSLHSFLARGKLWQLNLIKKDGFS